LGQISAISSLDLTLSLPNNLSGYVPVTNVSTKLSSIIEQDSDREDSSDESDDAPSLDELFSIGQWLRAVVVENENSNGKRRIELTIDPSRVNETVDQDDIVPGMSVQGCIQSVEDHGVIIDIGNPDLSGFISNKELTFANIEPQSLKPGQVLLLSVLSKSTNGRTVTLTASAEAKKLPIMKSLTSTRSLVAGTMVEALVTEIQRNGIVCSLFGYVDATIDLVHAGVLDRNELAKKFKDGSKIKARVIFSALNDANKLSLSVLNTVIGMTKSEDVDAFAVGQTVDAKVKYVDSVFGLYIDIGVKSLGFVHISRVSDDHIDDLETQKTYSPGSTHTARILGYSYADNLYILSMEKKVLEQKYLRVEDVPVGEVITGSVDKILPKGSILVKLWEGFSGIVSETHLSDVKLANPERKYKPGQKVTARVWIVFHSDWVLLSNTNI
jgi:rRNA biogenesis protein RRP5